MNFDQLNLIAPLLDAVAAQGYTAPTPIQIAAIPPVLAGRDVWACAQTGTGKTAAFALPILQRLHATPRPTRPRGPRPIRVLILVPTRELATQITDSFTAYGAGMPVRSATIFGGVSQHAQVRALTAGVDIVAATPGRLLDLMGQGAARLNEVEILVLDEADRMLDMGFITPIRKVAQALPKVRQTLMFSATMPPAIRELANTLLVKPECVAVTPPATTVDRIRQAVYLVEKPEKIRLLLRVLDATDVTRALVFTRTKHGADKVVKHLSRYAIAAGAIHGNKSQSQRENALRAFKSGAARVLVATDIAARGLDIDEVSHVVNYDLPMDAESYVHRIGRTARAGASGIALSFCDSDERTTLRSIEKLIQKRLPLENAAHLPQMRMAPPEPAAIAQAAAQVRAISGEPDVTCRPRRPSAPPRFVAPPRRSERRRSPAR